MNVLRLLLPIVLAALLASWIMTPPTAGAVARIVALAIIAFLQTINADPRNRLFSNARVVGGWTGGTVLLGVLLHQIFLFQTPHSVEFLTDTAGKETRWENLRMTPFLRLCCYPERGATAASVRMFAGRAQTTAKFGKSNVTAVVRFTPATKATGPRKSVTKAEVIQKIGEVLRNSAGERKAFEKALPSEFQVLEFRKS